MSSNQPERKTDMSEQVKVVGSATQPRLNAYNSFPTAAPTIYKRFFYSLNLYEDISVEVWR